MSTQRAAGLGEGDQLVAGLVLVGVAAPGHGAQAQPGDLQAGGAERTLLHGGESSHGSCADARDAPVGSPPCDRISSRPWSSASSRDSPSSCPISSSAHLRIFPELFGWGDPGAAFTAVIQIGTELAVLIYFRKDIWRIGSAWVRSLFQPEYRGTLDSRMGWYIIIGSLPIVVLGVLLKDVIERDFRNLWIIGTTLIVMGVVLGIADRVGAHRPARSSKITLQRRRADGRSPRRSP